MSKFKVGDIVCFKDSIYGNIPHEIESISDNVAVNFVGGGWSYVRDIRLVKEKQMSNKADKVYKLVEKKHLGYRYTTVDFVTFESIKDQHRLVISACNNRVIRVDLTPKTIEMLYELFRYLKTDLEEAEQIDDDGLQGELL